MSYLKPNRCIYQSCGYVIIFVTNGIGKHQWILAVARIAWAISLVIIVPFLDQVSVNGADCGQYLYLEDLQNVNKSDRTTSKLFDNSTIHDGFTK